TDLKKKRAASKAPQSPSAQKGRTDKGLVWVAPGVVAEVELRGWTGDRMIRHASYQGLREDKPAAEVVPGQPKPSGARKGPAKPVAVGKTAVKRSHPDMLLWPDEQVSKQQLLDHYALAWPRMERLVTNRPLALVRAPDGVGGQRFFQKHGSAGM